MRKVAVLGLVFAIACGIAQADAQISDNEVRIGILTDQSGPYADFGGDASVTAAQIAAEDMGGMVRGKMIRILSGDHQNKPELASTIAEQWLNDDHIDAVVDVTGSAVSRAARQMISEAGKVVFYSGADSGGTAGPNCFATTFQWTPDLHERAFGMVRAVVQTGGKRWFLLTADNASGHEIADILRKEIAARGGTVIGEVRHPSGGTDLSAFLLQAQVSGAQVIGLASKGSDALTAMKQAGEFGIPAGGQKLVALSLALSNVHAVGLDEAQGLVSSTAYYWNWDDASRAFAERYERRAGRKPGMVQASVYSAVLHYLKAVQASGSDHGRAVAATMRQAPVSDFFARGARIGADGRLDQRLFLVEAKHPNQSKGEWDYYSLLRTIPTSVGKDPAARGGLRVSRPFSCRNTTGILARSELAD
ncbi:ABC transporter substrate-binding protein [Rhodoligotrophos ferricapiens]|uniref:ABC transporter substrate-binding protein n=1 Tax=Rhodoligotrophos ferricapiens TaxID=3069264 RepID=UPI00315DF3FE